MGRRRLARGARTHLTEGTFDLASAGRFDARKLCQRLSFEGWTFLDEAEQHPHGIILVTARLGSWWLTALTVGLYRGGVDTLGPSWNTPHLRAWAARFGAASDPPLQRHNLGIASAESALRSRARLVVLTDDPPEPDDDRLDVSFLSRPVSATVSAARLSRATGAPVVPIFSWPLAGGGYQVVVRPPLWPTTAGSSTELTRHILAEIEREILSRPQLWPWWRIPFET